MPRLAAEGGDGLCRQQAFRFCFCPALLAKLPSFFDCLLFVGCFPGGTDLDEFAAQLAAPVLHEVAVLDLADGAGRCFRRRRVIHQRLVVR